MPNEYLSNLWILWFDGIIEPSHIIKALEVYGYQLSYVGNGGLKAFKENETFEYKHDKDKWQYHTQNIKRPTGHTPQTYQVK